MGREAQNEGYFAKFSLLNKIKNVPHRVLVRHTSNHPLQLACLKTYMWGLSSDFEQFFLVKNNFLCVFVMNKYAFQIGNAMEKLNSILPGKKCSKWKWLDLHAFRFLDLPIPMGQVLRPYIPLYLHYGLYVYINLETAHHRTTFGIFCNITENTTTP